MQNAAVPSRKTSLTGVKPTGVPHLGNYLGAIRPALRLTRDYQGLYFIADYHALTTERDPKALRSATYDVTATWLASGLDPKTTLLFRQADVIEVFELAWVLSCVVATGQLERGHAFKDAIAKGNKAPNAGIFYYPVLMAADIILYDTNVVPIGRDQEQHLEIARDMAQRVNHLWGEGTLVVPEALITEAPLVPGFDGEKMSKSRGNGFSIFTGQKDLRKQVMKFVTTSEPLEAPKEPAGSVWELYKLLATDDEQAALAQKLRAGNYGWGHAKQDLFEALDRELAPMRERYEGLRGDEKALDEILADGAARARVIARRTMARVRGAIGID